MSTYAKRILISEYDDAARDILSALLVQAGYDVHTTRNGRDAIAEMQQKYFDVMVADCDMPHLSGRELLSFSRAACPHIPIIMLLGEPAESSDDVHHLGAYAWVGKPYDTWFLLEIIRDAAHATVHTHSSAMTSPAKNA